MRSNESGKYFEFFQNAYNLCTVLNKTHIEFFLPNIKSMGVLARVLNKFICDIIIMTMRINHR